MEYIGRLCSPRQYMDALHGRLREGSLFFKFILSLRDKERLYRRVKGDFIGQIMKGLCLEGLRSSLDRGFPKGFLSMEVTLNVFQRQEII